MVQSNKPMWTAILKQTFNQGYKLVSYEYTRTRTLRLGVVSVNVTQQQTDGSSKKIERPINLKSKTDTTIALINGVIYYWLIFYSFK